MDHVSVELLENVDKTARYREIVKRAMQKWIDFAPPLDGTERVVVFDEQGDHYLWIEVGWHRGSRMEGLILHLDIRDGRIWIQHDGLEDGIVDDLMAAGVPESDIVMGWHPPDMRRFTPYAHVEK